MENQIQAKSSEINSKASQTPWSVTQKKNLFVELTKAQLVLQTFGKQASDLQNTAHIFIETLSDYTADSVMQAFQTYLKVGRQFPTPADIIDIIEDTTNGRGTPNHAIYREICAKQSRGDTINFKEKEYKKDYEDYFLS